VITGDLVKSRRLEHNAMDAIIHSLKDTFDEINKRFLDQQGQFEIFRGDSFQAIVPKAEKALLIALILRARLRSYLPLPPAKGSRKTEKPILNAFTDARIAIGIGKVRSTNRKVTESQGEAFENSGHLFDRLQKDNDRLGVITPWPEVNQELEVSCRLADAVIDRWTPSTAEAVFYHLMYNENQSELAGRFNISQPALRKRLVVIGNMKSINLFIGRFEQLITGNITSGGYSEL
ncbi:MAG: hypothetical protein ACM3P0_10365, partial [Acidobacteriota bacterium]